MTIRFNTFRIRMFATIVAGLAMTNVTFAKAGGKGFGGFSGAKSLGVQRIAPAVKSFAPKMVVKSPIMKIGSGKQLLLDAFSDLQIRNRARIFFADMRVRGCPSLVELAQLIRHVTVVVPLDDLRFAAACC